MYIKYKIHSPSNMLYMKMLLLNLNKYLKTKNKSSYIYNTINGFLFMQLQKLKYDKRCRYGTRILR